MTSRTIRGPLAALAVFGVLALPGCDDTPVAVDTPVPWEFVELPPWSDDILVNDLAWDPVSGAMLAPTAVFASNRPRLPGGMVRIDPDGIPVRLSSGPWSTAPHAIFRVGDFWFGVASGGAGGGSVQNPHEFFDLWAEPYATPRTARVVGRVEGAVAVGAEIYLSAPGITDEQRGRTFFYTLTIQGDTALVSEPVERPVPRVAGLASCDGRLLGVARDAIYEIVPRTFVMTSVASLPADNWRGISCSPDGEVYVTNQRQLFTATLP